MKRDAFGRKGRAVENKLLGVTFNWGGGHFGEYNKEDF